MMVCIPFPYSGPLFLSCALVFRLFANTIFPSSQKFVGTISTLKNVKKDVKEMGKDRECGISFANWSDFKPGDTIQCYDEKSTPRRL